MAPTDVVRRIVRHLASLSMMPDPGLLLRACEEIVIDELDIAWAERMRSTWNVYLPNHRTELQVGAPAVTAEGHRCYSIESKGLGSCVSTERSDETRSASGEKTQSRSAVARPRSAT